MFILGSEAESIKTDVHVPLLPVRCNYNNELHESETNSANSRSCEQQSPSTNPVVWPGFMRASLWKRHFHRQTSITVRPVPLPNWHHCQTSTTIKPAPLPSFLPHPAGSGAHVQAGRTLRAPPPARWPSSPPRTLLNAAPDHAWESWRLPVLAWLCRPDELLPPESSCQHLQCCQQLPGFGSFFSSKTSIQALFAFICELLGRPDFMGRR